MMIIRDLVIWVDTSFSLMSDNVLLDSCMKYISRIRNLVEV